MGLSSRLRVVLALLASAVVADDLSTLEKVFRTYAGGKAQLTVTDFAHAISAAIPATPLRIIHEIFPHHDQDGDGALSFEEFAALFPASFGLFSKLKQAHLSLAESGAMWITWVTDESESISAPSVRWGLSSTQLLSSANGSSHTFAGWRKTIHQVPCDGACYIFCSVLCCAEGDTVKDYSNNVAGQNESVAR
jgi:hypothetical protein